MLLLNANTYITNDVKHRLMRNALEQMHPDDATLLLTVAKRKWIDDSVNYDLMSKTFPDTYPVIKEINIDDLEDEKGTAKPKKKKAAATTKSKPAAKRGPGRPRKNP